MTFEALMIWITMTLLTGPTVAVSTKGDLEVPMPTASCVSVVLTLPNETVAYQCSAPIRAQ